MTIARKKDRSLTEALDQIVGTDRRQRWIAYAGKKDQQGENGQSSIALELLDVIEKAGWGHLDDTQIDHVIRLCSAVIAYLRRAVLLRYHVIRGWEAGGKGPAKDGSNPAWFDHGSRLVHRETGQVVYRSEPYELDGEGLRQLVKLMDEGWKVRIVGYHSDHFPSQTFAVLISRPEPSP